MILDAAGTANRPRSFLDNSSNNRYTSAMRLSFAMQRFLIALLQTGEPPEAHGMAEHGGRVCTYVALLRRGLITDELGLTDAGRAKARELLKSRASR